MGAAVVLVMVYVWVKMAPARTAPLKYGATVCTRLKDSLQLGSRKLLAPVEAVPATATFGKPPEPPIVPEVKKARGPTAPMRRAMPEVAMVLRGTAGPPMGIHRASEESGPGVRPKAP